MSIFDNNPYQQQQQILSGLYGGLTQGGTLGGFLGLGSAFAAQQPTIKFARYGPYGVKRRLSFFDELREEIDNWLKS